MSASVTERHQQWLDWARRNQLGTESQNLAAARAAVEAESQGATGEQTATAAREAAASIAGATPAGDAAQPPLSPGGITWEMAMQNAVWLMSQLPREWKWASKDANDNLEWVAARTAMAQTWISYATELTRRGRRF